MSDWPTDWLTNSMEEIPSLKLASFSVTQDISRLVWNLNVHYRIHNRSQLVLIPSHINSLHAFLSYFFKLQFNILLPSTLRSSKFHLSGFSTKILYAFIVSHIRATCPVHLIFLDVIIRIVFDKDYKSWRSSLCHFLRPPISSSLLGPSIFLSALSSNTLSLSSSLNTRKQVSHVYKAP
jgi:hypothetical protein